MEELKVGDLVSLKSGGPIMVVSSGPDKFENVICKWFGQDKNIHEVLLNINILKKEKK